MPGRGHMGPGKGDGRDTREGGHKGRPAIALMGGGACLRTGHGFH